MFPAARKADPITHDLIAPSGVIGPPITGPCSNGSVLIEFLPAAHVTCTVVCTGATSAGPAHPPPPGPPPPILLGSATVHIHSQFASRWAPSGDAGGCGVFLGNPALAGTRSTLIGGPTGSVVSTPGGGVTVTLGGMVVNGSPEDVAQWMSMLAREMGNSPSFYNAVMDMVNDTAHPIPFNIGRDNAWWVDSFANNNVDLNDLAWYPTDPDPDYPWAQTQGELMAHVIEERRHAAVNGTDFHPAHNAALAPGGLQHQYRQDRGQPGRIVSQVGHQDPTNPNRNRGEYTNDSGNVTIIRRDTSSGNNVPYEVEHRPAHPTPSAPGVTRTTPP